MQDLHPQRLPWSISAIVELCQAILRDSDLTPDGIFTDAVGNTLGFCSRQFSNTPFPQSFTDPKTQLLGKTEFSVTVDGHLVEVQERIAWMARHDPQAALHL
jgi:hypothetical protein